MIGPRSLPFVRFGKIGVKVKKNFSFVPNVITEKKNPYGLG
jgi:hypothetical protein